MTSPRKPLPLTRSSLDKKWEIKVSKDVKEYNLDDVLKHTLFDYVNDKDDPTSAANLATVSEQFYQLEKYQQAFADAIKTCLLHIAGYHYQVETISDKDDFFDLKENILYLKENGRGDVEFLFMRANGLPTLGIIYPPSLSLHQAIHLNNQTIQLIVPLIQKMHGWQPGLKAVSMAKQNYAVILAKSTFSEESRQWADPISPLQCAAWAGNTHLVKEFLDILPKELKKEALDQLTVVRDHGLEHPNLSGMLALKKNSTAFDGTVIQETFRQPAQVVMQFFHTEFPDFPEPLTLSSINRITHRTTHKFLPKYALQLELSTYDMLFDAVIDQFCELRQQVLMQQVKDLETEVEQYIKSQVDAHKVRQHRLSS